MTEDMDRLQHNLSGSAIQMAHLATQVALIGARLAIQKAAEAEARGRTAAELAAVRLRADRELAAAVWTRAHSETWLRESSAHEMVTVWANARTWSPYDPRAAEAVKLIDRRLESYGIDVAAVGATIDRWDPAALAATLGTLGPELSAFEPDEPADARAFYSEDPVARGRAMARRSAADLRASLESREETMIRLAAEAVRAEWNGHTAAAVIGDTAFPAFAAKLARLARDGYDRREVVGRLSGGAFATPDIRNPAAFAAWKLDQIFAAAPARVAGEDHPLPASEALTATGRPPAISSTTHDRRRTAPDRSR